MYNLDAVAADIGIDITFVEQRGGVEVLLRHTQDTSNGLHGEFRAIQSSEDEQYGGTRTIPAFGYGLFEKQHVDHAVWVLYAV